MSKWKTVNLEVKQYEQLKKLAGAENKSLGSKLGEAVETYLGTGITNNVDMAKLAGSVKWTNYRVALIYRWLELTMPQEIIEKAKTEIDLRKVSS